MLMEVVINLESQRDKLLQVAGIISRHQFTFYGCGQGVLENPLEGFLIPTTLSSQGTKLNCQPSDTPGTLTEGQKCPGSILVVDQIIKKKKILISSVDRG